MSCSFENCNQELHKRTKSGLCQKHRRLLYTRKWSNEHKEYAANRYQLEKEEVKARLAKVPKEQMVK